MFVLLVRPAGVFPIKTRPDTYTEKWIIVIGFLQKRMILIGLDW